MTNEHKRYFETAISEWQDARANKNLGKFDNAISLLLVAIDKIQEHEDLPLYHSFLAEICYEYANEISESGANLNQYSFYDKAIHHADIALSHSQSEFRAQFVKVIIVTNNWLSSKNEMKEDGVVWKTFGAAKVIANKPKLL